MFTRTPCGFVALSGLYSSPRGLFAPFSRPLCQCGRLFPKPTIINQRSAEITAFASAEPHDPLEKVNRIFIELAALAGQSDEVADMLFCYAGSQRDRRSLVCPSSVAFR